MIPIKDDIPSRSIPVVTYGLIALSVLAFGVELRLSDPQLRQWVGVLGGYFVMLPRARVLTLLPIFLIFPIVPLRATWFLGIWIIVQVINGGVALGTSASMGGVAWVAHAAGFVAGLLAIRLLVVGSRRRM